MKSYTVAAENIFLGGISGMLFLPIFKSYFKKMIIYKKEIGIVECII